MKMKGFRVFRWLFLSAFPLGAAEQPAVTSRQTPPSPSAAIAKSQDSAFALLIESYRQLQAHNIEQAYQARLDAAEKLTDPAEWVKVRELAMKERDLRRQQLNASFAGFGALYESARTDTTPAAVDTKAAAKKLKAYVAVKAPTKGSLVTQSEVLPAQEMLLNRPRP